MGKWTDEFSSSFIFYDSQNPSLKSSITDPLIPEMHSTMCSGTAYALWMTLATVAEGGLEFCPIILMSVL